MNRGGWKGRPVVVLGKKERIPLGLHPLVSMVARPVKHVRLVTALLKATALMRFKAQVRPTYLPLTSILRFHGISKLIYKSYQDRHDLPFMESLNQ